MGETPFRATQPFPVTAPSAQYSNAECSSLRDFRRLIEDVRPRDNNHQIVFRGQTREYASHGVPSLIPAARRAGAKHYRLKLQGFDRFIYERMCSEMELQGMRMRQAELFGWPEPPVDRTPWTNVYPSLVQHYCSGTTGMDVTFDGWIALWFASHEAKQTPSGVRFRPLTARALQSGATPVIYVIECLKPEVGRLIKHPSARWYAPDLADLRLLMRSPGLRANRQQAGILLAAAVDGSHTNACLNFVIVRIALSDRCVVEWLGRPKYSEAYLFPAPRQDYLYCWLLASRSAARVYRLARHQHYTRAVCAELMHSWKSRLSLDHGASFL
jgi:hypothetical protein